MRSRRPAPTGMNAGVIVALAVAIGMPLLITVSSKSDRDNERDRNVRIGPTVQISQARSNVEHVETIADAQPGSAKNLVVCSMSQTRPLETSVTVAYTSTDGGTNWRLAATTPFGSWDPDCHFASDGTIYFASDSGQDAKNLALPSAQMHKEHDILLWRGSSTGHGSTIAKFALGHAVDREWVAIDDNARSPYRGRIYAWYFADYLYDKSHQPTSQNELVTSTDGGRTFGTPVRFIAKGWDWPAEMAVEPDGAVLLYYAMMPGLPDSGDLDRSNHQADATQYVITSTDGGRSFHAPVKIGTPRLSIAPNVRAIPSITIDRESSFFKGRAYIAWADSSSGRAVIMTSHSSDDGKTWSTPVVPSDDFWNKNNERGPDDFMPVMRVNSNGVVGMMWYDRRTEPDDVSYDVRFSYSLDGGETWSPSVAIPGAHSGYEVSEYPDIWPEPSDASKSSDTAAIGISDSSWITGGHTAGMAATADGIFHPVWVDNRTRVQQLYTAPITVEGEVIKNGDSRLAGLADLTKQLHVEVQHPIYDRPSGTIAVDFRVQNISKRPMKMPLYARLISWHSDIGLVAAMNAENKQTRPGAVWQLGSPGILAPNAYSPWQSMTFHVSNVQSLHRDHQYFRTFLTLSARILGAMT